MFLGWNAERTHYTGQSTTREGVLGFPMSASASCWCRELYLKHRLMSDIGAAGTLSVTVPGSMLASDWHTLTKCLLKDWIPVASILFCLDCWLEHRRGKSRAWFSWSNKTMKAQGRISQPNKSSFLLWSGMCTLQWAWGRCCAPHHSSERLSCCRGIVKAL